MGKEGEITDILIRVEKDTPVRIFCRVKVKAGTFDEYVPEECLQDVFEEAAPSMTAKVSPAHLRQQTAVNRRKQMTAY